MRRDGGSTSLRSDRRKRRDRAGHRRERWNVERIAIPVHIGDDVPDKHPQSPWQLRIMNGQLALPAFVAA
jgi:hypothetical protein